MTAPQFKDVDFKSLLRLRLGGAADNAALTGISAGALLNNPAFAVSPMATATASALGAAAAVAGGAWLGSRFADEFKPGVFPSRLRFTSSPVPTKGGKPLGMQDGMTIGYCVDTGERVTIPWEDWMRHGGILGASGVGKTVLGEWLMAQQIMAGGGLLWVNGKLDPDGLKFLRDACAWAGREDDLLVINPGEPSMSNSYNPVLFGDPDECADRIMSLLPASESNPGADFYRQNAKQALTTLINAVQKTGKAYNFLDLTLLLMNADLMLGLVDMLGLAARSAWGGKKKAIEQAAQELQIFLDQYMQVNKDGVKSLDMKRMKEVFGGIAGRLHTFGTGNFGEVTASYDPDINLFEAIRAGKIVYAMLPTMGKKEAASNFGKIIIGDYRTAVSWIQDLPEDERPWPPFLSFFDEAGSYITPSFSTMFEQSRSARMVLLPAVQTMANYEAVSDELREMIVGNSWTKIFFKIGTPKSSEAAADMVGKKKEVVVMLSGSSGEGAQRAPSPTRHTTGMSDSNSFGYTEREEEVYKVSPDDFSSLDKGECIVVWGGDSVYQVKVPRLQFTKEFSDGLGPIRLNKFRKSRAKEGNGLNLFEKIKARTRKER